jgi:hypothetical protein
MKYKVYIPHDPKQNFARLIYNNTIVFFWECDIEILDNGGMITSHTKAPERSYLDIDFLKACFKHIRDFDTMEEFKEWFATKYFEYML